MIFWVLLVSGLVGSSVSMERVPFHKCKSGNTVSALFMHPCSQPENSVPSPPKCILYQGTSIKVNAIFIAPFSSSNLEIAASSTINGNTIPLPDTGNNPCYGGIIPGCPVMKGRMYIFTTSLDVLKAYPMGSMDVQYAIRDAKTKKFLGCAIIPIVIRKPKSNEF